MAAVTICSPGLAYCVAKYLALENKMTLFFWAPKSLQMVIAAMILKDAYSLEGKL